MTQTNRPRHRRNGATTNLPKWDNLKLLVGRHSLGSPVYVGDTAGDEVAARRAGIPYLHMEYGFGYPDRESLSFDSFPALTGFLLED